MMPNKTGTHIGMRVTAEQRVLEGHRLMRAAVAFLQVPSKGTCSCSLNVLALVLSSP